MIYTVGNSRNYRAMLYYCSTHKTPFYKGGRRPKYAGGIAFKTKEEAQLFIEITGNKEWEVFGLDADWEKDTVPVGNHETVLTGCEYHRLIHDRPIVLLEGEN